MNLPSQEVIEEDLRTRFRLGPLATEVAEYVMEVVDDHRELNDWEKAALFWRVWHNGLPDWADDSYVRTCARLCGWDYQRAMNAFVAAFGMDAIERPPGHVPK